MSRVKQLIDRKQQSSGRPVSAAAAAKPSSRDAKAGALLAWSHEAEVVRRQSPIESLVVGNPDRFNFVSASGPGATAPANRGKKSPGGDRFASLPRGQSWSAQNGQGDDHESDLLAILEERLQQQKLDLARSRSKLLGSVRSDINDLSQQYEADLSAHSDLRSMYKRNSMELEELRRVLANLTAQLRSQQEDADKERTIRDAEWRRVVAEMEERHVTEVENMRQREAGAVSSLEEGRREMGSVMEKMKREHVAQLDEITTKNSKQVSQLLAQMETEIRGKIKNEFDGELATRTAECETLKSQVTESAKKLEVERRSGGEMKLKLKEMEKKLKSTDSREKEKEMEREAKREREKKEWGKEKEDLLSELNASRISVEKLKTKIESLEEIRRNMEEKERLTAKEGAEEREKRAGEVGELRERLGEMEREMEREREKNFSLQETRTSERWRSVSEKVSILGEEESVTKVGERKQIQLTEGPSTVQINYSNNLTIHSLQQNIQIMQEEHTHMQTIIQNFEKNDSKAKEMLEAAQQDAEILKNLAENLRREFEIEKKKFASRQTQEQQKYLKLQSEMAKEITTAENLKFENKILEERVLNLENELKISSEKLSEIEAVSKQEISSKETSFALEILNLRKDFETSKAEIAEAQLKISQLTDLQTTLQSERRGMEETFSKKIIELEREKNVVENRLAHVTENAHERAYKMAVQEVAGKLAEKETLIKTFRTEVRAGLSELKLASVSISAAVTCLRCGKTLKKPTLLAPCGHCFCHDCCHDAHENIFCVECGPTARVHTALPNEALELICEKQIFKENFLQDLARLADA